MRGAPDGSRSVAGSQDPEPQLGIVYTTSGMVRLALDVVTNLHALPVHESRVLDIGCGFGQFAAPLAHRFVSSARQARVTSEDLNGRLVGQFRGVEVRKDTARMARDAVAGLLAEMLPDPLTTGELDRMVVNADFLSWAPDAGRFDLIVGNLPYVRYDNISNLAHGPMIADLRRDFVTFTGRADYSVPFLERVLDILNPQGTAAIITSNRFARAQYGAQIRSLLADSDFGVHEVDLSRIQAFETAVEAYASLLVLSKKAKGRSLYIRLENQEPKTLAKVSDGIAATLRTGKGVTVTRRGSLQKDGRPWSNLPHSITVALERITRQFESLHELGFGVRKGPATGADPVFVRRRSDFPFSEETKRTSLLPLFHSGSNGSAGGRNRFLLNLVEEGTGRLLALNELENEVADFLYSHRAQLTKRHMVRVAGRDWWGTIDRYDPALLRKTKVLVPDLRPADQVALDGGSLFPAHSVVCVTTGSVQVLKGLRHVLSSPVASEFRFWQAPDMGHTSPRASSTVLRRFPVPGRKTLQKLGSIQDRADAIQSVYDAYGLKPHERRALERQDRR